MRTSTSILALGFLVLATCPTFAAPKHFPSPLPLPIPRPAPVASMTTVLKDVVANSDVIVSDLQSAQSRASFCGAAIPTGATSNCTTQAGAPGFLTDPLGAQCFPAAIALIQSLPSPFNLPPSTAGTPGLIDGVEVAYLTVQGAEAAINKLVAGGLPQSFKVACDPWIMDNMAQTVNAAAAFTAFFAALVPK